MLVAVGLDTADGMQVFTDSHLERSSAGTVQDAHPLCTELDSIVDKVGNSLQSLVGPHSPHVDVGFEIQLPRTYFVGSTASQGFGLGCFLLAHGAFHLVGLDARLDVTESHQGVFLVDADECSHCRRSLEHHVVAGLQGAVLGHSLGGGLLGLFAAGCGFGRQFL